MPTYLNDKQSSETFLYRKLYIVENVRIWLYKRYFFQNTRLLDYFRVIQKQDIAELCMKEARVSGYLDCFSFCWETVRRLKWAQTWQSLRWPYLVDNNFSWNCMFSVKWGFEKSQTKSSGAFSIDYALNLKVGVLVWKCTLSTSVMVCAASRPPVLLKHTMLIKSFKSVYFVRLCLSTHVCMESRLTWALLLWEMEFMSVLSVHGALFYRLVLLFLNVDVPPARSFKAKWGWGVSLVLIPLGTCGKTSPFIYIIDLHLYYLYARHLMWYW